MEIGQAPEEQFAALAQRLRDGRSVSEVYQIVVESAVQVVDGCDRAAVGVLDGTKFISAASTDEVIHYIDRLQDEIGEGPCLEASLEQIILLDNDITVHSTWPELAKVVVANTPVRAMLAVPLVHEDRRSGALNLFADSPQAFTDESVSLAAILGAFASIALGSARNAERADQFATGMATNREIGTAVGILMATHRITSDEAFTLLAQASQRLNRKLHDIARGIVNDDSRPQTSP